MHNGKASNSIGPTYFLTELLGIKVARAGKRIGRLADFVIQDRDKVAEVTHIYVRRPFGDPPLVIPWDKIQSLTRSEVIAAIEDVKPFAGKLGEGAVLLKDHILDKRALDTEGREVEVVYDVKLTLKNGKLWVVEVDLTRTGLLRRIGMRWLANWIYRLAGNLSDNTVAWSYIEPLPEEIGSFKGDIKLKVLKEMLAEMPSVDLADIIEQLEPQERKAIIDALDTEQASDTLEELDPAIQRDLIGALEKERAAQLINEMSPGQAADLLAVLPWGEVNALVKLLNTDDALKIKEILEKHEERVLNFAVSDYLRYPPDETAGRVRRDYPEAAKDKDVVMYIYVLDEQEKLVGVIDIKELLKAGENDRLRDIMVTSVVRFKPDDTLKEAAETFSRYGFRAIPVTDGEGRMRGVVPDRDIMKLKHLY
jgi:magnesium transporter